MYVRPIGMCRHKERVLSFRVPLGKFEADLICLLWSHLSWFEGLTDLIGDDFMLLLPAGNLLILTLGEQEFLFTELRRACIGRDKFTAFCLLRVL